MSSTASNSRHQRNTQIKECCNKMIENTIFYDQNFSETQSRFVNQRVNEIETFFGDLCAELVSYTRRTAKLRNNGDEIVRILLDYSVKEKINRTTSNALKNFSEYLATVEDYRHTEVDRIVGKVVNPLASYGEEIKKVRNNLKIESAARKKELTNLRKLEKSSSAEAAREAEIQLHNAMLDATKSASNLERCVLEFEARRLKGLKKILTDFVQIEMLWHAKALETFSLAYNTLQSLHEEADLIEFRTTLLRSGSSFLSATSYGDSLTPSLNPISSNSNKVQNKSIENNHHILSSQLKKSKNMKSSKTDLCKSNPNNKLLNQSEDVTSLFTEGEDERSDHHTMTQIRNRTKSANEIEDFEDDDDDDIDEIDDELDDEDEEEDESEDEDENEEQSQFTHDATSPSHRPNTTYSKMTKSTPISTTNRITNVANQSPLKSALKPGISKQ